MPGLHVPPPQKTCRFHFKKPPYTHPRFTQCSFSLGHVFSSATQQTALRNATPRPVPSRAFGPIVDSWRVPDHPSARPARSGPHEWVQVYPPSHIEWFLEPWDPVNRSPSNPRPSRHPGADVRWARPSLQLSRRVWWSPRAEDLHRWRIPVALSDLHCLGLVRSRAAIWALPTLVAALGTQLAKGFDKTCCGKQATRTRRELSIDYFYVTCGTIFDLCNVWVHLKMGILQIHKNGNVKRYSDN